MFWEHRDWAAEGDDAVAQQEVEPDKTISHPGPAHRLDPVTLYLVYLLSIHFSLLYHIIC